VERGIALKQVRRRQTKGGREGGNCRFTKSRKQGRGEISRVNRGLQVEGIRKGKGLKSRELVAKKRRGKMKSFGGRGGGGGGGQWRHNRDKVWPRWVAAWERKKNRSREVE